MFNLLIKAVLAQRLMVMLGTVTLALAGLVAWKTLPIDAFPDVTNTQVMILTKASGLAAIDVEQRISYPLEQVMRGLPKVTQVRSLSRAGLSQVVVIFQDGVDTYWTRQVVFERLAMARDQLPPGTEPELGPLSTGLGEIFQYTLESDRHNAMELRTLQDWLVAPMLKPVAGVNEVNSFGGAVRQYQILLTPEKLAQYKLTVAEVTAAVERGNANAGGGVLVSGWEQVYLRGVGLLKDIPDIEQLVIKAMDGTPVRVKDVAEVVIGTEPRQGAVTRDGRGEVVAGMIIMLKGENSRDVVARVKDALDKVRGTLPEGVRVNVFYDRTSLVKACISTVMTALMEGSLFVILILFLFIAEMRTALIVVLSLPLTFLVSFILMGWAGLSSNLMSLGGLAFSVGMVVDASIVVIENIRRQLALRLHEPRRTVITEAVQEVGRPVAFSVMIIAIILVPLFTLQGIEGKMFAPLALTLLIALLVSLGVAFTTIPVLADLALKQEPEREFGFIKKFHHGYLALLDRAMRRPVLTLGLAGGILIASLGAIPFIGTEFMPTLDEGAIAINVVRLPNASIEGSVRVADFMEKQLRQFPEIESVICKTGRAEISEDPMGPEQTDVFIVLKQRKHWSSGRNREDLVDAINRDLSIIPGLRFSFSQPIALRVNELISGIKSDLAVKVFGPDLTLIRQFADRAAGVIRSAPGAQDTKVEQVTGMNQLDVVIDRQAAARHGIRIGDINDTIESAIAGTRATTLIEGEKRFAVVVRFEEKSRRDEEAIKRLWIVAPGGERVPLDQLASFTRIESPAQISRENGMRRVVVETNVRGRDLGGFVKDIQQKLAPLARELPPGYFIEYGGQFENQQRAMRQLSIVVPIALILIFILLFAALGSIRHSLLVLANLPFALVGGVLAVAAFGINLSVSSAVAFIVLLGIAVQNGVVLVAFFRQLSASGLGLSDTVRTGCDIRFRPLMMTALTSFIGHLPMLYATGSGADIQKPLAVVVMGGIITSQLLTLLVLPAMYVLMERVVLRRESIQ
ncbi:MAG: CusA/CzcA family heavy metal efflux RND transporter [bacterium]